MLERRKSKVGKPYFVCDSCGIQIFIRKKPGIDRLEQMLRNREQIEIPYTQHSQNIHEIRAILQEIAEVQQEIDKFGIFDLLNEEKARIRDALLHRKENLFRQLETFSEK